jgi:catechol 2,3-dioxygenase-like lactoylglutathione lyase family enzyme
MDDFVAPTGSMVLAHFIASDDVQRSRRFYTEVLGGQAVITGEPTYVALANSWIVINTGGGPTDDKPAVTLEPPDNPNRVSSFLNIRVADIHALYEKWSARGAEFLTPPKQHETEIRCYVRDPDGHLIEVGQTTLPSGWRPPSTLAELAPSRSGRTAKAIAGLAIRRRRPSTPPSPWTGVGLHTSHWAIHVIAKGQCIDQGLPRARGSASSAIVICEVGNYQTKKAGQSHEHDREHEA